MHRVVGGGKGQGKEWSFRRLLRAPGKKITRASSRVVIMEKTKQNKIERKEGKKEKRCLGERRSLCLNYYTKDSEKKVHFY